MEPAERVKVVLLGASNAGKTCIIHRWISGTFSSNQSSTIGSAYFSQIFEYEGNSYDINIWDTAGQEQFHSLAPVYCQGSSAGLIVYDILNRDSFNEIQGYIDLISNVPKATYMIVGNKIDLKEKRAVSFEEASDLARRKSVPYFEVSAVTGQHIDDMFTEFCLQAVDNYLKSNRDASDTINVSASPSNEKKGKCC